MNRWDLPQVLQENLVSVMKLSFLLTVAVQLRSFPIFGAIWDFVWMLLMKCGCQRQWGWQWIATWQMTGELLSVAVLFLLGVSVQMKGTPCKVSLKWACYCRIGQPRHVHIPHPSGSRGGIIIIWCHCHNEVRQTCHLLYKTTVKLLASPWTEAMSLCLTSPGLLSILWTPVFPLWCCTCIERQSPYPPKPLEK